VTRRDVAYWQCSRLVEQLTDTRVQFLQAVQVERENVFPFDPWKRRINQAVVADVSLSSCLVARSCRMAARHVPGKATGAVFVQATSPGDRRRPRDFARWCVTPCRPRAGRDRLSDNTRDGTRHGFRAGASLESRIFQAQPESCRAWPAIQPFSSTPTRAWRPHRCRYATIFPSLTILTIPHAQVALALLR
jgi:hypothetical protein